jgi:hypothetical protein
VGRPGDRRAQAESERACGGAGRRVDTPGLLHSTAAGLPLAPPAPPVAVAACKQAACTRPVAAPTCSLYAAAAAARMSSLAWECASSRSLRAAASSPCSSGPGARRGSLGYGAAAREFQWRPGVGGPPRGLRSARGVGQVCGVTDGGAGAPGIRPTAAAGSPSAPPVRPVVVAACVCVRACVCVMCVCVCVMCVCVMCMCVCVDVRARSQRRG